jgi:excisionase family DNA binding protein
MESTEDAEDIDRLPAMLTVAEAARVLRIGRTLAYQLAARFLAGDAHGLPAIRLGGCLRVPRWALIEFIDHGRVISDLNARVAADIDALVGDSDAPASPTASRSRERRSSPRGTAQLALALES